LRAHCKKRREGNPRSLREIHDSGTLDTAETVLLTTALIDEHRPSNPRADNWLTMKIALVPMYIALGVLAFRPGQTAGRRIGLWASALLVYGFLISVARARTALGFFAS
jgi:uncharacterized membrane protein SirB2